MSNCQNAKKIYDLYFNQQKSIDFIKLEIGLSKPAILKSLKKNKKLYEAERTRRITALENRKHLLYKKIQTMYFDDKLTPIKISKSLNISRSTITRALQESKNYVLEKEKRKISNHNKCNSYDEDIKALLNKQRKHAIEMSKNRKLNTDEIIKLNSSHYQYNSKKKALVFDESCGKRPNDIPAIRYL